MQEIISTYSLKKKYAKTTALEDVNFTLYKGDIYGLIGRNGAGKSTLLGIITGALKPTGGSINIQGETKNKDLIRARRNIGYMLNPDFFKYLTAEENLRYICKMKGILNEKKQVGRVLELMGLSDNRKKVKDYSMGMRQRLGIASSLLGNPDVVILDEPINGLDPQGIMDFRNMIVDINKESGTTFIISSHILTELGVMATRFGFLEKGRLLREMNENELSNACKKQLVIKTDNQDRAAVLLETKLGVDKYRINDTQDIIIENFADNPRIVADMIYENGLHLSKLTEQSITLEEFFFNMIGEGVKND